MIKLAQLGALVVDYRVLKPRQILTCHVSNPSGWDEGQNW